MTDIIVITNQKGGVGKSSTALALGAYLSSELNKKVLFIDLDAQCNLTYAMRAAGERSIIEALLKEHSAADCIEHTPNGDIIKASPALANIDAALEGFGKEYRLKEALEDLTEYDYIIIDTPPALNTLTINALAAGTDVIIPAQADIFSLQGFGQLLQTIEAVKKYANPQLNIAGLLITRYQARATLTKRITELIDEAVGAYNIPLFDTKIRECIAVKEAQLLKTSLFNHAPKSNAAHDYISFSKEYIKRKEEHNA